MFRYEVMGKRSRNKLLYKENLIFQLNEARIECSALEARIGPE